MDKSRQELMQAARHKLAEGRYSVEQREQIIHILDLLLEVSQGDEKTEENARSAAKMFANVTHHHNLLAIIQQQAAELDALKRITTKLTSSLQTHVVLDIIVAEAMKLLAGAKEATIYLYQDGALKFGAALDSDGRRNQINSLPRPNGITYTAARDRSLVVVDNVRTHQLFADISPDWAGSIVSIPLITDGMVIGVMNMARWEAGAFTDSQLRLLGLLADQAALAIMNARMHQAMASQALSDTLTGLPNRRALDARLENDVQLASRYGHQFAIFMIDLDGFKSINDTYGHSVGDTVLRQYAQFLGKNQRSTDFLARYGGDELVMILPETNLESAKQVADHIRERASQYQISMPDGSTRFLALTGGIAVFPVHAHTASDLLRSSDDALYRAKHQARGTFLVAEIPEDN